jgi:hypothetical protein
VRVKIENEEVVHSIFPQDQNIDGNEKDQEDEHEHKSKDWHGHNKFFPVEIL